MSAGTPGRRRDLPVQQLDEPGGTISKVYPFRNYYETLAFVNAVARRSNVSLRCRALARCVFK